MLGCGASVELGSLVASFELLSVESSLSTASVVTAGSLAGGADVVVVVVVELKGASGVVVVESPAASASTVVGSGDFSVVLTEAVVVEVVVVLAVEVFESSSSVVVGSVESEKVVFSSAGPAVVVDVESFSCSTNEDAALEVCLCGSVVKVDSLFVVANSSPVESPALPSFLAPGKLMATVIGSKGLLATAKMSFIFGIASLFSFLLLCVLASGVASIRLTKTIAKVAIIISLEKNCFC